jgi:hypothetical protein
MTGEVVELPRRQLVHVMARLCSAGLVGWAAFALLLYRWMPDVARPLETMRIGILNIAVVGAVTAYALRHNRVWLDPYGITVARWGRRNAFIPWNVIWSIDTRTTFGYRGVRLRTSRAPVSLPVPVVGPGLPNPRFDAEVDRIVAWWQHCRTAWPPPPAPGAGRSSG